ncbi:hypothetical protein D1872_285920 [compost metagenome]
MRNRIRVQSSRNQTCDMSHIHHEQSTYIISNGRKSFEINRAWISTRSSNDQTRTMLEGSLAYFIIINQEVVLTNSIGREIIQQS